MAYSLASMTTVRVTGTYLDLVTGAPLVGTVVIEPQQTVRKVDGDVLLLPNKFEIPLDFSGRAVFDLPVGDDPDYSPQFIYRVTEKVRTKSGGLANNGREPFLLQVSTADVANGIDLIEAYGIIVPDPGPGVVSYLLKTGGTITGNLVVTGSITAGSITGSYSPSGNFAVPGNLSVTGTTTHTGATTVGALTAGATTVSSLTSSGAVSGTSVTASGAVTGASASVTGAITSGTVAVTGAVTAGSATVSGAVAVGSLNVTGTLTGDGITYNATGTKRLVQGTPVNGGGLNTVQTPGTAYAAFSAENTNSSTNAYAGFDSISGTADSRALQARVAGDAAGRLVVQADGKVLWGDGTTTRDTNLYRSAADTLATDDSLTIGGNLNVTGNVTVTGTYPGGGGSGSSITPIPWRQPARPFTGPVVVVESFQTGHGWVHDGGFASVAPNQASSAAHHGTQIYRATTDNAGTTGSISVTGKSPLNLSGKTKQVVFWLNTNQAQQQIGSLYLRAASTGGLAAGNYLTWQICGTALTNSGGTTTTISTNQAFMESGLTLPIPLSMGDAVVTGSPDRSAITEWRIIASDRNNGTTVQFNFDGIEVRSQGLPSLVPSGYSGLACFTFDDSAVGQYSIARQVLGGKGWVGTVYPIIDVIGTNSANYYSATQLRALYEEGWEVGVHSYAKTIHDAPNTNADTAANWKADAYLAAQWTADQGYGGETLAYPNGSFGTPSTGGGVNYWRSARSFWEMARTVQSVQFQLNPVPLLNPMQVRAITVGGSTWPTVASICATGGPIDRAAAENALIVFTVHNVIATGTTGPLQITTADLQTLVNYVESKGLSVVTMGQVADAVTI